MKQTAVQQAISMVRNRIDSIDETLTGKHTIHHLQQIERGLYELLEKEMVNIESNPLNGNSFMDDLRNKYMEKQTAVEYLFEQLWDTPKDKLTWYSILKKAKEMEKVQIENAFVSGEHQQGFEDEAQQYYNETFNTNENGIH